SGEEAGLLGSEYYAGHPLFPLEKIRFLINLDLVSTGSDGIMVINGEEFNEEFELLVSLNREENLVKEVKKRGPSNNSDHYPFYRRGVPCFFIHTLGEYSEYHTVDDKPERLPFSAYNEFFTLLTLFVQHLE
ncbi:MAG TPA: M28 family peptidase, partial [Bacteroidales bacterium]|nr:M28 family peptidase [Bacteroidales bacterium]